jgi:hypothetical protein
MPCSRHSSLVGRATCHQSLRQIHFFTQNKNYIACLDGRSLILLAFASSVLNASGHVLAWLLFDAEANQLEVRFATMFTGDLLGALILLYALKGLVISFEQRHKQ